MLLYTNIEYKISLELISLENVKNVKCGDLVNSTDLEPVSLLADGIGTRVETFY